MSKGEFTMNKLFNKIATITLGLAMAIGVGVAAGGKGSGARNVKADTSGTLTLTRSCFPSGSLAYNTTDAWSATCSPSSDGSVSGQGDLYSTNNQTTMQTKASGVSTHYHNTTAMPGYITGIKLNLASGTDRVYTVRASKSTAITSTTGGTQLGTTDSTSQFTTGFTQANDYHYFWLTCTGGASFLNSIVISYTIPSATKTLSSISVNTHPDKVTYTAGEYFDPTGLIINRVYTDSTYNDTYEYADHESEFSFTPNTSTALTTDNTSVSITYGEKTTSQAITVNAPVSVTGVTLDKDTSTIEVDDTDTLTATVAPANATNKSVTWSTSDDSVATVDNGVVTGVAAGSATITVTTVDGSFTDTCAVTVKEPSGIVLDATKVTSFPYQGITLSTSNGVLDNGTDYRIYKGATLTITSSVGDIAKIEFTFDGNYDGGGWSTIYRPDDDTWTSPACTSGSSGRQARITKIVITLAEAISSLEITGSMSNTTYTQYDPWNPAGFTVNAYYESAPSTPVDVTSDVTWSYSPETTASTSTTSVVVTATYEGKTASSSAQTVTINEIESLGGLTNGRVFLIVGGHVLKAHSFSNKGADTYTTANSSVEGLLESDAWYFESTGVLNQWTIRTSSAANADYLYSINDNNGLVSGGTSDSWTVEEGTGTYDGKLIMKDSNQSRYISYTTSSTSYIRTYTNTNTGNCEVTFVPYEEPDVLDSELTLTGTPASLTAGSTFPGVTKAEAEYSKSGTLDVTSNVTYTLGGTAISVGDTIPVEKVGNSVTVVVTYTDAKSNTATASFNVPVVYKPVTSVTLNRNSATIAKGGTVSLTATVEDGYALNTVKWLTSDNTIATVSPTSSQSGNSVTVTASSSNSGSATITAYVDEDGSGTLNGSEKYATCAITVSADPVLNMLDSSENVISGESLHAFTTDSNIYLHVLAENFVGEITYTWSSSNTNAISIVEEADEMCEFSIDGAGSNVRLSCHAVGATSGDLTTYVDYTVTEPQIDEVTWSAPATLSVYDNASLTAANISSWSPVYHKDNGDTGSISSGYTVKIGGVVTSLTHNWSINDDGKELWIEYGGIASSHINLVVTEHLENISYSRWELATSISAGDVIVIGNAAKGEVMTSATPATGTLGVASATIENGVIADLPSTAVKFTVGGTSGAYTLIDESGNYLNVSTTAKTSLYLNSDSSTTSITFSSDNAIFGNESGYRIVLNASASPHRFSTYNSALSTSMVLPQIYKSTTSNIANTNVNAQRALISFAKTFNSTMNCDDGGETTNINSKWSTLSTAFSNALNALSPADQIVMKRLVANASSIQNGDTVQDMLARYDYIVAKYKLGDNDFLHSVADRGAVKYSRISPLLLSNSTSVNTGLIVTVVSIISVVAIGGYFFLRKKKEQ